MRSDKKDTVFEVNADMIFSAVSKGANTERQI
jgi:hypothetical protein